MATATHPSAATTEGATGLASAALATEVRAADPAVISAATLAALEKKGGTRAPLSKSDEGERERQGAPPLVSLDRETRTVVDTATAAFHLNRRPQTLRAWACHEDGPIRPMRVHGRLGWRTADIRRLLGVAA